MTLRDALNEAARRIARRDAEVLAQHVLGRDRAWLLAHSEAELAEADAARLHALAARRANEEPLQHLTGVQEFFGLPFAVGPEVLIPRPETELLVEAVMDWLAERPERTAPRVLDVGTGSGAIAITLAKQLPKADVTACDVSPAALEMARTNARRLGVKVLEEGAETPPRGLGPGVRFVPSDLLSAFADRPGSFDVIVSNPPYVALADAPTLAREVVAFEPHLALFAGSDGLDVYRRLVPQAHAALEPGGLLAMEFGFGQREPLSQLFELGPRGAAWTEPRFLDDYAGTPRVVLAEKR